MDGGNGTKNLGFGQINFGAFPRSGNHTLGKTLSLAFPQVQPFWLGHRISDLSFATNCAVVVRNPLDSVSSWLESCKDERIDGVDKTIDWYIRYMKGIIAASDNVIIFSLEDLSEKPYECAIAFAKKFGLHKPNYFSSTDVGNWMSEYMPEHFPNNFSFEKKKRYDSVLSNLRYVNAVSEYRNVLSLSAKVS